MSAADHMQMRDDWRDVLRHVIDEVPDQGISALVLIASVNEDNEANSWTALGGDRQALAYLLAGIILRDQELAHLLGAYMAHLMGPDPEPQIGVN